MKSRLPYTPVLHTIAPYLQLPWAQLPLPVQTLLTKALVDCSDWDHWSIRQRSELCRQCDELNDRSREPVLYLELGRLNATVVKLKAEARSRRDGATESMLNELGEMIDEIISRNRSEAGEEIKRQIEQKNADPRELTTCRVLLGALAKDTYADAISKEKISKLAPIVADLERHGVNFKDDTISNQLKESLEALEKHVAQKGATPTQ